jgi:type III secretion translocon protein HrpF
LQNNIDQVPDDLSTGDLGTLAKDESLPQELRDAYSYMNEHPGMVAKLDTAKDGGEADGNISKDDLAAAGADPKYKEANREAAKAGMNNFVPSDAPEDARQPRQMTASDANRELYLYAESLPDPLDEKGLQKIVDAGSDDGKCPAQLRAAAQFMLDRPGEFNKIAPGGSVERGYLQDNALANVNLRPGELTAIRTVQAQPDRFMTADGKMNRESLTTLAADTTAPQDVRLAAQKLLDDPLVFGMLDNANHGHQADRHNGANDGEVGADDLTAIDRRLSATNLKPPAKPKPPEEPSKAELAKMNPTERRAAEELRAKTLTAMDDGWANDPEIKTPVARTKSALQKFAIKALPIVGKVLDVVKTIVDAVAGVLPPPFSTVLVAAGAGIATWNNFGVKAGAAMLSGTSAKDAYIEAAKNEAIDLAGSAISLAPGGGVLKAGATVAKEGVAVAKTVATQAAKEGAESAAEAGVKAAAKDGAQGGAAAAARQGAASGAREGAETAGREAAEATATRVLPAGAQQMSRAELKANAREGFKEGVKEAATDQLMQLAQSEWGQRQQAKLLRKANELASKVLTADQMARVAQGVQIAQGVQAARDARASGDIAALPSIATDLSAATGVSTPVEIPGVQALPSLPSLASLPDVPTSAIPT